MLQTTPLRRRGVEFTLRVVERTFALENKPKRNQQSRAACDEKITEPAIVPIPIHCNLSGFLRTNRNSYGKAQSTLFGIVDLITRA